MKNLFFRRGRVRDGWKTIGAVLALLILGLLVAIAIAIFWEGLQAMYHKTIPGGLPDWIVVALAVLALVGLGFISLAGQRHRALRELDQHVIKNLRQKFPSHDCPETLACPLFQAETGGAYRDFRGARKR